MNEGFDLWSFFTGLPLGIAITAAVLLFSWKRGKKERRYDERYTRVHQHARSISWIVTTIVILIAWTIIIIVEGPGLAFFIMTGIWIVHMGSYVIGAVIANKRN